MVHAVVDCIFFKFVTWHGSIDEWTDQLIGIKIGFIRNTDEMSKVPISLFHMTDSQTQI